MAQLLFAAQAWSHMGAVSGYSNIRHALFALLGDRLALLDVRDLPDAPNAVHEHDEFLPWVDDLQRRGCSRILSFLHQEPGARAILSAGEDQLCRAYFDAPGALLRRLFVVLHQPPSWFAALPVPWARLGSLGGIISLSRAQAEFFRSQGLENVIESRHGVNHQFFTPGTDAPRPGAPLLVVGQWLRDFDLLERALSGVWVNRPRLGVVLVVGKPIEDFPALARLAADPRVRCRTNVPDDELRSLYRSCSAVVLPLKDAVVNNALLEALSCGARLAITRLPSTMEYLEGVDACFAEPGDAQDHAAAILRALEPEQPARRPSASHDVAARRFDWDDIARELLARLCSTARLTPGDPGHDALTDIT
jgi:glycosyltransferase involved in cell wall biosynthesis